MTLPGFHSPAIGFEQPFEMLSACHERVERTLALFERLVAHVRAQGHDAASRSAAADVLRYFDLAAPHHHQDEERHVLPRLRASGVADALALADTLEDEHRRMEQLWARLREPLLVWREAPDGAGWQPVFANTRGELYEGTIDTADLAAIRAMTLDAARRAGRLIEGLDEGSGASD